MSLPPVPHGLDLDETQQPRILAVNIVTLTLAYLVVALRLHSRSISSVKLWWDDWLIVSAVLFSTVIVLISVTWMLPHGLGKHVWAGKPDAGEVWAKGLFISELAYTGTICSIKFSLLALYRRIFGVTTVRFPVYILGAVVTCWGIAVVLVSLFQCSPIRGFWDKSIEPTCINTATFFVGNSVPNIVTDAAILVLPIPYIWQFNLARTQKLILSGIFILGIFVVAVSITRITYIYSLDTKSPDITWNFVSSQIWSAVETNIGIICACLPSLQALIPWILPDSVNPTEAIRTSAASKKVAWFGNGAKNTDNSFQSTASTFNPLSDKSSEGDEYPVIDKRSQASLYANQNGYAQDQHVARPMSQVSFVRPEKGGITKRSDIDVEYHPR